MAIYRDNFITGTPDQIQELINRLNDLVETATDAATSATTSYNNTENLYQAFTNLYLGAFSSAPSTDNDGTALDGGELYYDTTQNQLYVYDADSATWSPNPGDFFADGSVSMTGTLQMDGNEIENYSESSSSPSSSAGTLTLDLANGNIFSVTLTENVTTLTISNVPASGGVNVVLILTQDATGSRTITWPASVKWASGFTPTLTTTANAVDIISMFSVDGGTTWYAFSGGLDMQ